MAIGKPVEPLSVLSELDKVVAAFLRKPEVPYTLVTSLSLEELPQATITVRGHAITSIRDRGAVYPLPEVLVSLHRKHHFADHLADSKYLTVKVSTSGRTHFEAAHKALNAVNLLRAAWSLPATMGHWSINGGRPGRRPIGVFHVGPVHTLHTADGQPHDDMYWYEPDYREDQDVFRKSERWPNLEKFRRLAIRTVCVGSFGRDLEDLLIRYVNALDQANPNVAFLQMWSILEKVTNTVGGKYDETIERARKVFVEKDRPLVKEVLNALRHNRNRLVHAGMGNEDTGLVYLLKRFVDQHLLRLVRNDSKVASLQEYAEFLMLPTDHAELKRRIGRLSQLLQYSRKRKTKRSFKQ